MDTTASIISTVATGSIAINPIAINATMTLTEIGSAQEMANYGHGYRAIMEESTLLKTFSNILTPSNCLELCKETKQCKAWALEFYQPLTTRKPDCSLFSAVTWSPEPILGNFKTVVGDLAEYQFSRIVAPCGPSTCTKGVNYLPIFLGEYSGLVYDSTCTSANPKCINFSSDMDTACCSFCGVPGYPACSISPFEEGQYSKTSMWTGLLPKQMNPIQNGWGCWTNNFHVKDKPTKVMEVKYIEDCQMACQEDPACELWSWKSSANVPAIQKCELFSAVPTLFYKSESSNVNDILHYIGLDMCLAPFEGEKIFETIQTAFVSTSETEIPQMILDYGSNFHFTKSSEYTPKRLDLTAMVEMFSIFNASTISSGIKECIIPFGDASNPSVIPSSTMAGETMASTMAGETMASTMAGETMASTMAGETMASTMAGETMVDETMPTMAGETETVLSTTMAAELAVERRRLHAGHHGRQYHQHRRLQYSSSNSKGPGGQLDLEGARHFAISNSFLVDVIKEVMLTTPADVMSPIEGATAEGVVVDCSSGLSRTDCIINCTSDGIGIMEVGVAMAFEIGGENVPGPYDTEMFVIDGVCDSINLLITDVPTDIVGSNEPTGLCYSEGIQFIEGTALPFETVTQLTVQACQENCESNSACLAFNFIGPTCNLKQNSLDFDIYSSQGESLCTDDCTNDSECHTSDYMASTCKMYDTALTTMEHHGPSKETAAGPVVCALKGEKHLPVLVPPMNTATPIYDANINAYGVNKLTIDDFETYPPTEAGKPCAEGFSQMGDKCLKVFPHRLSLDDARRTCSYLNATLYNPTLETMNMLCDAKHIDCASKTRNSSSWTRLSLSGSNEILDMGRLATADVPVGVALAGHVAECLYADFATKELIPTSCGAYCVAPATELSAAANSTVCGVDGRYAVLRKPFICEQNPAEEGSLNPIPSRIVSYMDATNTKRCATYGADIVGGDLWNTATWAEPVNNWYQCEGMCRDISECKGYSFVPPHCSKSKEEVNKGNPPSVIFTESTRFTNSLGIEGPEECAARCMQDAECNAGVVYNPGVCYIKGADTPVKDALSWLPVITGPTSCTADIDPIVPVTTECPDGFFYATEGDTGLCVAINFDRLTGVEAHRACVKMGGILASPKTEIENEILRNVFCPDGTIESCVVPRGNGALDGVYYFGLGSTRTGINNTWHWVDGSKLTYPNKFGGQPGNANLVFNGWPTTQPDNSSGNQMCSYYYPLDSPPALNGGWGDEDCETECLQPTSPYLVMTHSPACLGGAGREMPLGRRYVCTAAPKE